VLYRFITDFIWFTADITARKDDLLKLMNEQTELKQKLETAEEQMLELMMELESLEQSFQEG